MQQLLIIKNTYRRVIYETDSGVDACFYYACHDWVQWYSPRRGLQNAALLHRPVRLGLRAGKDGRAGYHRALYHQHQRRPCGDDRRHHSLALRRHQRLCGQYSLCRHDDPGHPLHRRGRGHGRGRAGPSGKTGLLSSVVL